MKWIFDKTFSCIYYGEVVNGFFTGINEQGAFLVVYVSRYCFEIMERSIPEHILKVMKNRIEDPFFEIDYRRWLNNSIKK